MPFHQPIIFFDQHKARKKFATIIMAVVFSSLKLAYLKLCEKPSRPNPDNQLLKHQQHPQPTPGDSGKICTPPLILRAAIDFEAVTLHDEDNSFPARNGHSLFNTGRRPGCGQSIYHKGSAFTGLLPKLYDIRFEKAKDAQEKSTKNRFSAPRQNLSTRKV